MNTPRIFVGIDVQLRRHCPYFAIDPSGAPIESGWLPTADQAPAALRALITRLADGDLAKIAVGIDAPRRPLPTPRRWSWKGSTGRWTREAGGKGAGRHCEVVIKALNLANPQWTPVAGVDVPDWMQLGFDLFHALADLPHLHEVFPSAAYRQLEHDPEATLTIGFAGFAPGPKDMLDAALAALVVRDFSLGRGDAVGDGDRLGAIILPRPIGPKDSALHRWPDSDTPGIA